MRANHRPGRTTSAFIDGEISAVRWRHWRIYPKQIITSSGNPSAHEVCATRAEGTGYPAIFNITPDPREEMNVVGTEAWVIGVYIKIVGAYQASIKAYPNPQGFSSTTFPRWAAVAHKKSPANNWAKREHLQAHPQVEGQVRRSS